MVKFYLQPHIMPMMLESDEPYLRRLVPADLAAHGGRILFAVREAQRDPQGLARIGPSIQALLDYCLSRKTFRGTWFEDFCNSAVFRPLMTVIDMIPEGFAGVSAGTSTKDWPKIHAMVCELLVHECHRYYNPSHFGYSLKNLLTWGLLYTHYAFEFPILDISEEFGPRLERADEWSNHLATKVDEGDYYCRIDDNWYSNKYEAWAWIHDPNRWERLQLCYAQQEYDLAMMSNAEREEYQSEESSFHDKELSTNDREAWSNNDNELVED
jgi:hypothetical protein